MLAKENEEVIDSVALVAKKHISDDGPDQSKRQELQYPKCALAKKNLKFHLYSFGLCAIMDHPKVVALLGPKAKPEQFRVNYPTALRQTRHRAFGRSVGGSGSRSAGLSAGRSIVGRWIRPSAAQPIYGRLVGRSVGRSAGRSVGRSVGWSVGRLADRSVKRLVGRSVSPLVGRSAGGQLGGRLGGRLGVGLGVGIEVPRARFADPLAVQKCCVFTV